LAILKIKKLDVLSDFWIADEYSSHSTVILKERHDIHSIKFLFTQF
jgi:hypothetical protein